MKINRIEMEIQSENISRKKKQLFYLMKTKKKQKTT